MEPTHSLNRPTTKPPPGGHHARSGLTAGDNSADIRQTVGEVLRILVLRRWVFMVPFCLATTAAFVASHYIPRVFEATTTFEQTNDPVSVNLPPPLVTSSFDYFLSTLEQDIKSGEVIYPILNSLSLLGELETDADGQLTEAAITQRDAIAQFYTNDVKVAAWRKGKFASRIELRYVGSNRAVMGRFLDMMKSGYKQLVRRRLTEKLTDARDWYADQAEVERASLEEIDGRVASIRLQYPGIDPANPESIAIGLNSIQTQIANLNRANSRLESQIAAREDFLTKSKSFPVPLNEPSRPGDSGQAAWLKQALSASERRVESLRLERGMTLRHPDILAEQQLQHKYREQLSVELTSNATEQPADSNDMMGLADVLTNPMQSLWMPAVTQVEMDLSAKKEQLSLNKEESAQLGDRLGQFVNLKSELLDNRQDFARMQEELDRARNELETYQTLVVQCDQSLTVENENRGILFTDVDLPGKTMLPISPMAKTVLLLSIMAGLVTGAVFVILAELFDRRFRTTAQVIRALGLPLLENVSEIITEQQRRKRFRHQAVVVPIVITCMAGLVIASGSASYLSLTNPHKYDQLMSVPRSTWADISTGSQDLVGGASEDTEGSGS